MNDRADTRPEPIDALESAAPWKRGLVVVALLCAVLVALMPEAALQNRIFLVPDATAWESFATVGRGSLAAGEYPLWNPYIFCGMPSFPSQMYTPYVYPVSFVTHLLHAYAGFPELGWLLVHYLLAGAGMYLLCRSLGMRWGPAALAGVLFMILPNYVAVGAHGHGSQASAIAWMPFAALLALRLFRGGSRVSTTSLLALVLGIQMMRGHIQISYYTFLVVGTIFLWETVAVLRAGDRRAAAANAAALAAAVVGALGVSAVLVLPVREYAEYSIRGGSGGLDYGYATGWSLHPKEMITFVFPWAFGYGKATYLGAMPFTDYPNYLGVVAALWAAIGAVLVRRRWKWLLVALALLSTLVSFGSHFPILYDPMFRWLPFFNKFRVPVMIIVVQQLALTALAAGGIDAYLDRLAAGDLPRWLRPDRLRWAALAAVVLFVLAVAGGEGLRAGFESRAAASGRVQGGWGALGGERFAADAVRTAFFFLLAVALILAASARRLSAGRFLAATALVAAADLFVADRPILHPESTWERDEYRIVRPVEDREAFKKPDEAIAFLQKDPSLFRIFPVPYAQRGQWSHNVRPFSENRYMVSRIASLGGYHAAKLQGYQDVMDGMFASFNAGGFPAPLLDLLGAKYLLSFFPIFRENEVFPLVWQDGGQYIYENTRVLPRVFVAGEARVLPRERILETLVDANFDPARTVLLETAPDPAPDISENARADIVSWDLNEILIEAHLERPGVLVLSEIAYPDWRATVDGEEREVLTADYCLRALALEAGDHRIRFAYRSRTLERSLVVSIAFVFLCLAVPAACLVARRKE
ncbi:MAG: hypothetical protein JW876_05515 [Candidatus Krumholzibacteriota bacterium]|nr:hypothetical protein [Candidatus Krumholzibacteriota bacterium]